MRDQVTENCCSSRLREKLLYVSAEKSQENTVLAVDATISTAKGMETVGRDAKTVAGNSNRGVIKVEQVSGDAGGEYAVSMASDRCSIERHLVRQS